MKLPLVDRKTAAAIAGVVLLCVAPSFLYSFKFARTVPVLLDVDLHPGISRSPEFTVPMNTGYAVELVVDTPLPDEFTCFIDRVFPPPSCDVDPLHVTWLVLDAGHEVASGDSRTVSGITGGDGRGVARILGRAELQASTPYVLEIACRVDASALNPIHPRIRMKMLMGGEDEYLMRYGIASTVGLTALFVGAGGLVMVWVSRRLAA
jgi:hypothetical protein